MINIRGSVSQMRNLCGINIIPYAFDPPLGDRQGQRQTDISKPDYGNDNVAILYPSHEVSPTGDLSLRAYIR